MSKQSLDAFLQLCKDTRFSHITYCSDYGSDFCTKKCHYAVKMMFINLGKDEQTAEELATGGLKYGDA